MQYTEDFKRGIVRTLLASGMTRKEFAAETKITVQALRKWVKQYKDEEIKNVDGIGDKTFESLKSLITID